MVVSWISSRYLGLQVAKSNVTSVPSFLTTVHPPACLSRASDNITYLGSEVRREANGGGGVLGQIQKSPSLSECTTKPGPGGGLGYSLHEVFRFDYKHADQCLYTFFDALFSEFDMKKVFTLQAKESYGFFEIVTSPVAICSESGDLRAPAMRWMVNNVTRGLYRSE